MSFVANGTDRPVLPALRELLDGAEEALLCSAFVDERGLLLLSRELRQLGGDARLVATSTFGGSRTLGALEEASALGVRCRVLNPRLGTFHPKVVVARHDGQDRALVGSANLTSGLVVNIEACELVARPDAELRSTAESWWDRGTDLATLTGAREREVFEPELWSLLRERVPAGTIVLTLGAPPRPNRIIAVERTGIMVETRSSASKGIGPQLVEPRMVQLAWDVLRAEGWLSNRRLLDELRVHRSSFVCALLATLPGVEVTSRRPIVLELRHDRGSTHRDAELAADRPTPPWPTEDPT